MPRGGTKKQKNRNADKGSAAKCWHENLVEKFKIFVQDFVLVTQDSTHRGFC